MTSRMFWSEHATEPCGIKCRNVGSPSLCVLDVISWSGVAGHLLHSPANDIKLGLHLIEFIALFLLFLPSLKSVALQNVEIVVYMQLANVLLRIFQLVQVVHPVDGTLLFHETIQRFQPV